MSYKNLLDQISPAKIDYYDYSKKDLNITYNKGTVCKIEKGDQNPSTDFLFLIHKLFNKSLDYLAFGHTLQEIEEFVKIYSSLDAKKQEVLCERCFSEVKRIFKPDRKEFADIPDFRSRLNEVKKLSELTNNEFCKLIGASKNTVEKYHSKIRVNCKEYEKQRVSSLDYLMKVCNGLNVSLDYLLEGTYFSEDYPSELSNELRCYNYTKQRYIHKIWLDKAKQFKSA